MTIDRRQLLKTFAFSVPTAWLMGEAGLAKRVYADVTVTHKAPTSFMDISRLLTNHKEIDAGLAHVAWSALVLRAHNFSEGYEALQAALVKKGISDYRQYANSDIAKDPDLHAIAVALVGAWYLGRVGEVKPRSEDGPAFISYTGALMWQPTIDVTVIPTYSRGQPGFWAEKPASVATD